ncbi:MAG: hypothetical protein CVU63_11560 [Deltaproteobacteria bacterium HGW-Deltaproteobacteria-20]|nr:MAG: hypothetical protein CVU63_11560 [Deltaproteobacteria bacterium HGW-Deltaproteobacteria-20]
MSGSRLLLVACLAAGVLGLSTMLACSSDDSSNTGEGGSGGGGSGGTGGGGDVCYSVPVNVTGDGTSACESQVCSAGQHCAEAMFCDPGCLAVANCAEGQTCDFAAATGNPPVGTCRSPHSSEVIPCATGGSGGGSGTDCMTRCKLKAASCDAPAATGEFYCNGLCATATESQLACVEATSCQELGEAFESGSAICGIGD